MHMQNGLLRTKTLVAELSAKSQDYYLYKTIYEFLDGQRGVFRQTVNRQDRFEFIALDSNEKNKELHYMLEQDSVNGKYIGNRMAFERVWAAGEYFYEHRFLIPAKYIDFGV